VAGDDHNGPKRRQMRRLGLRYVFFFPRVFFLLTNEFYFDLGPHYVLKAPKELRWAATTITGPNDASGLVWALEVRYMFAVHRYFFFLYTIIFVYY
jgi:hypothetical protein